MMPQALVSAYDEYKLIIENKKTFSILNHTDYNFISQPFPRIKVENVM